MDAVEDVKARLSIEDVVGEYVELKRAGRNWRGLSPWTAEKTPSLMISPEKGIWHDFSSGKGGNMFSFVMEMEGLDFKATLELLARKAGVDLAQYNRPGQSRGPNKERLYAANEAAAYFYQVQFSKNRSALEYVFKKRQFNKETALTWRLGYSPASGTALGDYLKSKKFTQDEIKRAGLASSYGKDMFRGRLMIPLADAQGRIVGFTARQLVDQPNSPKYINTPATAIYDKSRQVFGLHHAKEAIRKANFVVLAEGNLDVIASHQAGVKNVVATAGTAMTEQHLKALARFTDDVRLAFDADKAGLAATERSIPLASHAGVNLSIITIPSGKDPDELIRRDPGLWEKVIQNQDYALDWLIERYQKLLDVTTAKGKREFSDVILPVVKRLDDKVEQDHYLSKIAEIIEVSRQSLEQKMTTGAETTAAPRRKVQRPEIEDKALVERRKLEQHLLAVLLNRPELKKAADLITPDMLNSPESRELWNYLEKDKFDKKIVEDSGVQNLVDYAKILSLEFEELYRELGAAELTYEVAHLQNRLIEQYVKAKKTEISAELTEANETKTQELLIRAKQLDDLLKRVTRGGEANYA